MGCLQVSDSIVSYRFVSCRAVPWVWIGLPGMVWYDIVFLVGSISLSGDGERGGGVEIGGIFIYGIYSTLFSDGPGWVAPCMGFEVPALLEYCSTGSMKRREWLARGRILVDHWAHFSSSYHWCLGGAWCWYYYCRGLNLRYCAAPPVWFGSLRSSRT